MDELLDQFLIEGRELVAQASRDFDALSRNPSDGPAIDGAFRAIHTLKGSVGIFPMEPALRVLHAAEDVLSSARKSARQIDAPALSGLIACLDAVDRWIDEIEEKGGLGPDADRIARDVIAQLPGQITASDTPSNAEDRSWLAALLALEHKVVDEAEEVLTAFHYAPDEDCFLRGEDPLAVIAAIPDLVSLRFSPSANAWPPLNELEPFVCLTLAEGLSAASENDVRAAFRTVTSQVALASVEPRAAIEFSESGRADRGAMSMRVDAARIDRLADGLGELVVATNAFAPLAERAEHIDRSLAAEIRAVQATIERAAADLHRSVSSVRLVPLAPTLRRLPRLAREIAGSLGKEVEFRTSGDTLEIDKQIADGLFEPLLHLVRNALDHGIETPQERELAGKKKEGQVSLSAGRDGDAIVIVVEDDGAGIDSSHILAHAIARQVLSEEAAGQLSEAAAMRLIFAPGFSTASEVTDLSGRGVGMDAVQVAVERLRGTVELTSAKGRGTRFVLRLPANALTTRLLIVEVGAERYGVALDHILETVRIDSSALMPVGEGTACVLRGRTVPVLSLPVLLGGEDSASTSVKLLVTRAGGERVALKVDAFAERIDTIVRPPSGLLANVPGVTGSTLLGDGGVLLVLDLPALAA